MYVSSCGQLFQKDFVFKISNPTLLETNEAAGLRKLVPKVATSFSATQKDHFRTILQNFHNFFVIFLSLLIKTNDSVIGRVNQNTATSSAVAKLINRCLAAQSS